MPLKSAIAVMAAVGIAAGPAAAATVTVKVNDVASARGRVLVALCKEPEFLKECALKAAGPAARGVVTLTLKNVPAGRYAAVAFHDENDNKTIDRTKIGVPSEGTAMSRDAMGTRGPPAFSQAAVDIPAKGASLDLNLVYY